MIASCKIVLFIVFILNISKVSGQDIVEKRVNSDRIKQMRIEQLSKRLNISAVESAKIIAITDTATSLSNKIYNDTLLSNSVKKEKLNAIAAERDRKLKLAVSDPEKVSPMLVHKDPMLIHKKEQFKSPSQKR